MTEDPGAIKLYNCKTHKARLKQGDAPPSCSEAVPNLETAELETVGSESGIGN